MYIKDLCVSMSLNQRKIYALNMCLAAAEIFISREKD